MSLPDKIKRKHFTKEEQIILSARASENVILDAADEAIYKPSRRASRNLTYLVSSPRESPVKSPRPLSMDSAVTKRVSSVMSGHMYETFRWMDEEKELDLRLPFDNYHANLDGVVIPSSESDRRPSFRRHMSISKLPFGRSSTVSTSPHSPNQRFSMGSPLPQHTRSRSRLSVMAPDFMYTEGVPIDPPAAHYQDPEARLKLRVYLASPQKFDEAIEFGFPAKDTGMESENKENAMPLRLSREAYKRKTLMNENGYSFIDDSASLFGDDASSADPDSPMTPSEADQTFHTHRSESPFIAHSGNNSGDFQHLGFTKPTIVKQQESSYSQASAGNREMTLRMTLTRPDLRANDSAIYGWQSRSTLRDDSVMEDIRISEEKTEMRGPFGGTDGWGPEDKDGGVVKRIWNKVKSSQRKVT
jgi:hypothetical protein